LVAGLQQTSRLGDGKFQEAVNYDKENKQHHKALQ